jgi:hypothetical protein
LDHHQGQAGEIRRHFQAALWLRIFTALKVHPHPPPVGNANCWVLKKLSGKILLHDPGMLCQKTIPK